MNGKTAVWNILQYPHMHCTSLWHLWAHNSSARCAEPTRFSMKRVLVCGGGVKCSSSCCEFESFWHHSDFLHACIYLLVHQLTSHTCSVWLNVSGPEALRTAGLLWDLKNLEAPPCFITRRSSCVPLSHAPTLANTRPLAHTHTHPYNQKILLGPSSQISISFHCGMQMSVKYLWKIAMIGFIMLPTVSRNGNEFGILGWRNK